VSCTQAQPKNVKKFEVTRTEAEWKKMLTSEQYTITRKQGTEDLSKMLITIIMKMERIHVLAVTFPCLAVILSLKAVQVGQAFTNR
jgi:hypothetical protein